jgi:hypothetical protein
MPHFYTRKQTLFKLLFLNKQMNFNEKEEWNVTNENVTQIKIRKYVWYKKGGLVYLIM